MEALFEVFSAPSSPSSPSPLPASPSKLSPVSQSSRSSEEDFPVLYCSSFAGRTTKLLHNGFVKQGLLQCILDCTDCFPHCFTGGAVPLFGHMTVTCSSLHNNNSNNLFLLFRHHLYNIISSTGNNVSLKYCCEFLHFIVTYVSRLSLMSHTATLDGIITNLTNTIQSLESCDQLNEDGIHVLLHVYWTMVSLLYTAVTILGDKYVSMFNEECNRIIKYLLKQREDTFDTASVFKNGVPSLFPCSCFLEVWLLVAKATDRISSTNRTPSFLELLYQCISGTGSIGFNWWVLVQCSALYGYSNDGVWNDEYKINGQWTIIKDIINKTFKSNEGELAHRWSINCCNYIYNHWSPLNAYPVIIAWEYYQKNMNNSFVISDFENRWLLISESGYKDILEAIGSSDQLTSSSSSSSSSSVLCGTSFELFLNLLSKCLSDRTHGSQIWRQLKTRIYSKISRKKVLELSGEGLSNMISVFLTLCHSCDQEDIIEVGQQFYTSLEYRQLSSTSEKNLKIIWKGILLLLMIYHSRGISIYSMAILSNIRKNIEILAVAYSKQSHSILVTDVLYNTLSTILEGLHQLLVNRCIHVQQLIGPYFRDLIKGTGKLFPDILRFIISMVSTINEHLHELSGPVATDVHQVKNYKSLLKDLYQHCMIPLTLLVEDTSSSFHRSEDLTILLVETSIAVTTCVCKWLSPQLCTSLVEGFGLSDTTLTSIVISYLDQVLSNSSLRDKLFCTDELQCRACHSLLVSLIRNPQYSSSSLSIESLTNSVSLLPFIQSLTGHDEVSDPLLLILQSLKGINSNYESSLDLVKWRNYLLIIIGDIISLIEPSLANGVSLSNAYQLTSSVVRHCSKLIYSKTDSKCLLPLLLNKLMISSSSGQPPEIPALVRKYLCHFLHGLFVIDKDQFIDRKIKQIFSHYFLSYLQSDPNSSTNPFVLLVSPAFYESPNKYDCCSYSTPICLMLWELINALYTHDVFLRVLDIISKQQLMIDESIPNVTKVLNFLHMLLSRVKYYYLILEATPILLGPLLSLFLRMGPSPSTQNCVVIIKKIFRKLFETNKSHADELPHLKLMPVIQEYLVSNLLNNKEHIFSPLIAIAAHYPTLISQALSLAIKLVEEHESKTSRQDDLLRKSLKKLEEAVTVPRN